MLPRMLSRGEEGEHALPERRRCPTNRWHGLRVSAEHTGDKHRQREEDPSEHRREWIRVAHVVTHPALITCRYSGNLSGKPRP